MRDTSVVVASKPKQKSRQAKASEEVEAELVDVDDHTGMLSLLLLNCLSIVLRKINIKTWSTTG